ncbi:MAG TPA: sigma-70 family RNA polymerase sigma factor [Polyangiaceae bacterium]|nr:sigma-70 family RNA polymerase sigma factor [Polyangiaceae bacterium]
MLTRTDSTPRAADHPDRQAELVLRDAMVLGDASAWKTFQERYGRLVTSAIVRVVGRFGAGRDSEDVREIEATLAVDLLSNGCSKLRAFDPNRGARLGTWIAMLASHAAYDFLRKKRREPRADGSVTDDELVSEMPDPHGLCELGERARLLAKLTAGFSEKDREFLELYFAEGLDPAEVATRMGISIKTVYSKKHKIVGRLEEILEKKRLAA